MALDARSRGRAVHAAESVGVVLGTPAAIPAFFGTGLYRQYLAPGETVIVLPYGILGEGMLWQATSGMYFRMAGGYVSFAPPVPEEQSRWPIVEGLYQLRGVPAAGDQFKAYLANHGVGAVILGPRRQYRVGTIDGRRTATTWRRAPTLAPERDATVAMLDSLGGPAIEVGGVTLYRPTPQTLAPYRKLTALTMERRAARTRFDALLLAAKAYLDGGGDPASLSPERAQQLGPASPRMVRRCVPGLRRLQSDFSRRCRARSRRAKRYSSGHRGLVRCARTAYPELWRRRDWNLFPLPVATGSQFDSAWPCDAGNDVRRPRSRPSYRIGSAA